MPGRLIASPPDDARPSAGAQEPQSPSGEFAASAGRAIGRKEVCVPRVQAQRHHPPEPGAVALEQFDDGGPVARGGAGDEVGDLSWGR